MRHEPYTLLTNRTIPFHARPINKHNLAIRAEIVNDFGMKAHHILDKLFGGYVIANCTDLYTMHDIFFGNHACEIVTGHTGHTFTLLHARAHGISAL
jgi:hypothetical protein